MFAYVGQTRARELVAQLRAAGVGECTQRGELPPRREPWFYDNGAYSDFTTRAGFDYLQWSRDMRAIRLWQDTEGIPPGRARSGQRLKAPDFAILPDRVADWPATVASAHEHHEEAARSGAPMYLAVQDGATGGEVRDLAAELGLRGLFVGGSLDWKLATGWGWCELAHANGLRCHIGRVGTADRVRWARDIGADSIDSCLPLWDAGKLAAFLEALQAEAPARLF